jgi:hypothetical protein
MTRRLLSIACWLTLAALALMVYSVLVPRPIPVVLAMSVGQGLGTLAFLLFAFVFLNDLKKAGVLRLRLPWRKK